MVTIQYLAHAVRLKLPLNLSRPCLQPHQALEWADAGGSLQAASGRSLPPRLGSRGESGIQEDSGGQFLLQILPRSSAGTEEAGKAYACKCSGVPVSLQTNAPSFSTPFATCLVGSLGYYLSPVLSQALSVPSHPSRWRATTRGSGCQAVCISQTLTACPEQHGITVPLPAVCNFLFFSNQLNWTIITYNKMHLFKLNEF